MNALCAPSLFSLPLSAFASLRLGVRKQPNVATPKATLLVEERFLGRLTQQPGAIVVREEVELVAH